MAEKAHSVITESPREHRSTIFAPAFASDTTVANAPALYCTSVRLADICMLYSIISAHSVSSARLENHQLRACQEIDTAEINSSTSSSRPCVISFMALPEGVCNQICNTAKQAHMKLCGSHGRECDL